MILNIFKPLGSFSNEELMQRVSEKDDDRAFDELYRRHARRLIGFFYRQMNRDEERASDLMQDAFMRVWSNRDRWNSGSEFLPWVFTIAFNLCKNEYRHMGYQAEYESHILYTNDEAQDSLVEIDMDTEMFDKALISILNASPPDMRTLFSLRFEEELSVPQISEIMGIPQGTVKSRLYSLTQILKEKLQQYGNI